MNDSRPTTSDLSDISTDTNPPTDVMASPIPETASAIPSRESKIDSTTKSVAAKPTQLEAIKAMLEERGLTEKFEKFLPSEKLYTFIEPADAPSHWEIDSDTSGSWMYLGQNAEVQTWAFLGLLKVDGRMDLTFWNVPLGPKAGPAVRVDKIREMSLMYPMKILKHKNRTNNLEHLKHLIKYLYLCTGKVPQVFIEGFKTASDQLRAAINLIERYYDENGGWENAPGIHGPDDVEDDDTNTMDGREPDLVRPTRSGKSKSKVPDETEEAESPRAAPESFTSCDRRHHGAPSAPQHPRQDKDGEHLSAASDTDITGSSKRRREEGSQTDTARTLKRREKEVKKLEEKLETKETEVPGLRADLREFAENMSDVELAASFTASSEESNE